MTRETPFFALLIGINSYKDKSLQKLRGAIPDALEFKKYLNSSLNVPNNQITLLTNENATRSNIIAALKDLKEDKRIIMGDAMFLYYAGHGTEIKHPNYREYGVEEMIQAIVPYDCDVEDESGKLVPPLPDYVIGILLSKIAEKKGDNITVIFDCCHSASGTRDIGSSSTDEITRSVVFPSNAFSKQIIQELSEVDTLSRGIYGPSKISTHGLGSHVLLSACRTTQNANEYHGHGRFSLALLNLLKKVPYNTLRYSEILDHPSLESIPRQDPQCEGLHVDRILFNAKVLCAQGKSFPISFDPTKNSGRGQYTVQCGTIHSITLDSEFGVYRKTDINLSSQIGTLKVDNLQLFSFTAKLPPHVPSLDLSYPLVAVQIKFGKQERLRIHIPPRDGFLKIYHDLIKSSKFKSNFANISLVDKSKDPHVEITLTAKNEVRFTMRTKVIVPDQVTPVIDGIEANPERLAHIFSAMVHFYWEFKNSNVNERIARFVQVEFYELEEEYVFNNDTGYEDIYFNQVDPRSNLYVGAKIELPAHDKGDGKIPYGLKLINKSGLHLFANVFHFSIHDLKISPWAQPQHGCIGHDPEVPLKSKGGSLQIGFGTAGYPPKIFKITNGLDTEVGFLKIYLSTEPVDLSYLTQHSPFTLHRSMDSYKPKPSVIWSDIVIPVVVRRHRTTSNTVKHK